MTIAHDLRLGLSDIVSDAGSICEDQPDAGLVEVLNGCREVPAILLALFFCSGPGPLGVGRLVLTWCIHRRILSK